MSAHHKKAGQRHLHARSLAVDSIANQAAAEGPVVITEQGKPLMAVPPGGAHEHPPETTGDILEALSTEGVCEIEDRLSAARDATAGGHLRLIDLFDTNVLSERPISPRPA